MAQIHALTPEGRLPSKAVAHALELIGDDVGIRTVSIDDQGRPYLDSLNPTHYILAGADGVPYISETITSRFILN